jgi:ACR3 family arsenite efflux pump ArsB
LKSQLHIASGTIRSSADHLASRDKEKPFILMGAILAGWLARLNYAETTTLAFTTTARNSEAVIAVAVNAFPGHSLVYFAVILGPVMELPILLFLSRVMLELRHRLWMSEPVGALPE